MDNSKRCIFYLSLLFFIHTVNGIRCYQCSSANEPKGQDICGAYGKLEKEKLVPVDCNGEDANTPGTFCMKMVQQGPIGYIWDGRWRQVIRRCASVAEHGNTEVCNWGVYPNNVYWEECYCSQDGCNSSYSLYSGLSGFILKAMAASLVIQYVLS